MGNAPLHFFFTVAHPAASCKLKYRGKSGIMKTKKQGGTAMKIVVLDAATLGADLDLSPLTDCLQMVATRSMTPYWLCITTRD
jgi:hypothetical protein